MKGASLISGWIAAPVAAMIAGCSMPAGEQGMNERPMKGHINDTSAFHALHPAFEDVFRFLRTLDRAAMTPDRTALDGERVFYVHSVIDARPAEAAPLEAHRRYIDVQYLLAGRERMGWRPVADCSKVRDAYDGEKDIMFFSDAPSSWIDLQPGEFAIFFPDDAHAPLIGTGTIEKIVVKIEVMRQP